MGSLSQSLLIVVEVLLVITLPFVGVAAFQYLRLNSVRVKTETKETERKTIAEIVKMAVSAAEQTGLLENLLSAEKKELALEIAERFLREQGINVNLRQLADLVEAEVRNMATSGTDADNLSEPLWDFHSFPPPGCREAPFTGSCQVTRMSSI